PRADEAVAGRRRGEEAAAVAEREVALRRARAHRLAAHAGAEREGKEEAAVGLEPGGAGQLAAHGGARRLETRAVERAQSLDLRLEAPAPAELVHRRLPEQVGRDVGVL